MKIADRRRMIVESLNHERDLKAAKKEELRHQLLRARDLEKEIKTLESRKQCMAKREEVNLANKAARLKDNEAHADFLKSSLKIIS